MTYIGAKDIALEIAKGNVPGHSGVNKFGRNPSSASGAVEDLWSNGGTYSFPTTVDITHIREATDQVADRSATIQVQGLDTSWNLVTQTVDLNAGDSSTPVALGTALRRVFRMTVLEDIIMGDDIELRNVGGGTTYAIIIAGVNQTQMALYTVPIGFTAYITGYYGSVAKATGVSPSSCTFGVFTADRANTYEFRMRHEASEGGNGHVMHAFNPYLAVAAQNDILMKTSCFNAAGSVNGGFDIILVAD